MPLERLIQGLWYGNRLWSVPLLPLAACYWGVTSLRKAAYRTGLRETRHLPVPVVVVGNITVGGTGKTPLVIWLARWLARHGYRPGVLASGYGGRARFWPQQVRPDSDPNVVGDEPVVIARHSRCPVAAGPDRLAAATGLLRHHGCTIIVSDDGLQHLRLGRDVEIAVVDGQRRYGNRRLLPAGPLREPLRRLERVDFVVANGAALGREVAMRYRVLDPRPVGAQRPSPTLHELRGREVHALAGIGHPERFFSTLRSYGLRVIPHPFPDHHAFTAKDLRFKGGHPVVMTEKDAVKCARYTPQNAWYIPIEAELPKAFEDQLLTVLEHGDYGQAVA
ncbi:MAG: tetraacyldisaccharide 4'-kinase [Gammaproteobacteria bacterium]